MTYLDEESGASRIKCLASDKTKCSFSFPDALENSNVIQMFEHLYVRDPPIYASITNNLNKWVKEKTVSIVF